MEQTSHLLQQAEQYSYLWNPPGMWRIETSHGRTVHILVRFSGAEGPSLHELILLRQWLPDLTHLPPIEMQKRFKDRSTCEVGIFGGSEGHHLYEAGKQLGLDVVTNTQSYRHTIFVCPGNGDIVKIQDDELNLIIEQKMRDADCSTVLTEED